MYYFWELLLLMIQRGSTPETLKLLGENTEIKLLGKSPASEVLDITPKVQQQNKK